MKEKYHIGGMTCSACQSHVQKAVGKLKGIEHAEVHLLTNSMTIEYDEKLISSADIVKCVEGAGYTASLASKNQAVKPAPIKPEHKGLSLVVSAVFTLIIFYLAMGPMMSIPLPFFFQGAENAMSLLITQFILSLPVLYLQRHYFINGFHRLFKLSPNMDTLIAIGASASMIYGIYILYAVAFQLSQNNLEMVHFYAHDVYFESAVMILTLVSFGKFLEGKSKKKTNAAIEKLMDLSPKKAIVLRDGVETEIPIEEVQLHDHVVVKKGMLVPIDGIIIEGSGSLDQSNVTGESIPVFKEISDSVISSSILNNGYIVIEAQKIGEDTTINTIIKLVEEAANSKAPISKLADKISGVFVPIVLGISLISFIFFMAFGYGFEFSFGIGISIMVIACPCALGLATPVAIMVGTGVAAKNGLLIKNAEILEKAHLVKTVILDKTGTITEGKPEVTDILSYCDVDILSIANALEQKSEHPLASAIILKAKEEKTKDLIVTNYESHSGKGISGDIDNITYYIGNETFLSELNLDISDYKNTIEKLSNESKTPLFIATKEAFIGIIAVKDMIKEDSIEAIKNLKSLGIDVVMLTGDNYKTAASIAQEIGIQTVISDILPEKKQEIVSSYQNQNSKHLVAMVGDGVNDAPALSKADVGIAIGAGSDIAIESADVILVSNSLNDVYHAIKLSRRVINNIKGNLFWAFFYNCIGIILAAGVLYIPFGIKLNPMISAAAMSLSSVFVVTNALSINLFKIKKKGGKNKMNTITLSIDGMTCKHCSARVETALLEVPGVSSVEVSLENKNATIKCQDTTTKETLINAVLAAGYSVL